MPPCIAWIVWAPGVDVAVQTADVGLPPLALLPRTDVEQCVQREVNSWHESNLEARGIIFDIFYKTCKRLRSLDCRASRVILRAAYATSACTPRSPPSSTRSGPFFRMPRHVGAVPGLVHYLGPRPGSSAAPVFRAVRSSSSPPCSGGRRWADDLLAAGPSALLSACSSASSYKQEAATPPVEREVPLSGPALGAEVQPAPASGLHVAHSSLSASSWSSSYKQEAATPPVERKVPPSGPACDAEAQPAPASGTKDSSAPSFCIASVASSLSSGVALPSSWEELSADEAFHLLGDVVASRRKYAGRRKLQKRALPEAECSPLPLVQSPRSSDSSSPPPLCSASSAPSSRPPSSAAPSSSASASSCSSRDAGDFIVAGYYSGLTARVGASSTGLFGHLDSTLGQRHYFLRGTMLVRAARAIGAIVEGDRLFAHVRGGTNFVYRLERPSATTTTTW